MTHSRQKIYNNNMKVTLPFFSSSSPLLFQKLISSSSSSSHNFHFSSSSTIIINPTRWNYNPNNTKQLLTSLLTNHSILQRIQQLSTNNNNKNTIIPTTTTTTKSNNIKMSNTTITTTIACIQLSSNENKSNNFKTAKSLIIQASTEKGAKVIFLPEAFDFIARTKEESATLSEHLEGPLLTSYRELAKDLSVWLSLGGFHEKHETELRGDADHYYNNSFPWMTNNHILIDSNGKIASVYRKVHLFDVVIPEEKVFLQESAFIKPGNEIVKPVETPIGNLGLGVCYDMRFPGFSLKLRSMGADIISYPSAFTVPTGMAHWETLLRARAIETQCYVVAAAQTGQHNSKRVSYGHSLIVDPWGKVLANGGEEVGIITAEIDLNMISSIRKKMPVLSHSRPDLYNDDNQMMGKLGISLRVPNTSNDEYENDTVFSFGHITVNSKAVFLESNCSRAFVNRKCVVPGHVLVSPKNPAKRLHNLSQLEISDLFCLAQKVQCVMESLHGVTSSTITVQDGKDAGQTVEHVHIHVLPRKPDDFKENDEIYEKLKSHDKGDNVKWRDDSDMFTECVQIREHIIKNSTSLLLSSLLLNCEEASTVDNI